MLINNTNTPNFQAKYVSTGNVKKLNPSKGCYERYGATLLEFDSSNKADLAVLKNTFEKWKSLFGRDIYQTAENIVVDIFDEVKNKVYFFTKQSKDFDNLKVDDVLGLVDVEPKKNKTGDDILEIHRLQVDTALIDKEMPAFKHVGTGILNSLKEKFNMIIELDSVPSATEFYEKNNFVDLQDSFLRYCWTPKA